MNNNKALWWALLAVWCGVFIAIPKAHAGVGRDRATGQAVWDAAVNGRTTNIGGAGGTWKVVGPATTTSGTAAGSAKMAGTATATVDGKAVPVNVAGEIPKDAIVTGLVTCLTGNALGCVIGVATPLALNYLAQAGTLRQEPTTGVTQIKDKWSCTYSACWFWRAPLGPGGSFTGYVPSPQQACTDSFAAQKAYLGAGRLTGADFTAVDGAPGTPGQAYNCWGTLDGTYRSITALGRGTSRAQDSPTWYPATPQEIKDALYVNNPPVAMVDELARYGNIIWPSGKGSALTNPTVTGPASIDGPKNVTQRPDGSKVTKQDKTNYSYNGPDVTRSGVTTTTTTTGPDGTTVVSTETSTTTESAGDQPGPPKEEEAPTDTPLPALPALYQRKYPDGMEGIWNAKKAEFQQSRLMTLKDQLLPSLGSTGTCPAMPIPMNFASWASFGTVDVAPPCWVWDFGKVVVILSAMFLARALIFGG